MDRHAASSDRTATLDFRIGPSIWTVLKIAIKLLSHGHVTVIRAASPWAVTRQFSEESHPPRLMLEIAVKWWLHSHVTVIRRVMSPSLMCDYGTIVQDVPYT